MINFDDQLLIIPEKSDPERDKVAEVWQANGGQVLRLGRFWEPPTVNRSQVRLYGNDTFCLVLAQQLSLELISPSDDLLIQLNNKWLKRDIQTCTLVQTEKLTFPQFIKPVIPKQFRANVYQSREELKNECQGLQEDTVVLVSELVEFTVEARAFILEEEVRTCAIYEGKGDLKEAYQFISNFAQENSLPKTCVIDIGYLENKGWAVVEANATWGAGLNGCEPLGAAVCIAQATVAV